MWSSLLGTSLLIALNPVLLGIILLVLARPRPVQNLLVYWLGALLVNLPLFLTPLALLHLVPGFASFADDFAEPVGTSSAIRPGALVTALVLFFVAGFMIVRSRTKRPLPSRVGDSGQELGGGHTAQRDGAQLRTEAESPSTCDTKSRPLERAKDAAIHAGIAVQQMHARLTGAWENGSLWVALIFGMLYLPSLTLVLLVDTAIATSGAGVGEQVAAAIMFVLGFLAILEITLLSYVIAPARTEAVLQPVHEWARIHTRKIMIAFFTLAGLWQLARGLGLA